MSCIEKILSRRSVRKFTNTPVTEQILNNILEAGRLAPSATNNQPWHFVVVKDSKGKDACDFQGFNRWVNGASFVIVGFYRSSEVIIEKLSLMDVAISLQNMVIAGWVQGVSSCWMGAFDERKLKNSLELPSDARIVGAIAFGISNEKPRQPSKKPINEIFHFEKWKSR
ncbi:MAG: nitroreductase family protein [Candidatus Bathyarchaeota archaeon]|jgi:nitroreductase